MRLSNPSSSRAAFYDRNPLGIGNTYRQVIAPAATTTRWTYTVPTGRKALIESAICALVRFTVAAPVSYYGCWEVLSPGGINPMDINIKDSIDNTVNLGGQQSSLGLQAAMLAGDVLKAQTEDLSTGGTVYFDTGCKTTEYDA